MVNKIFQELREHSPFTLFGALTGIVLMMVFRGIDHELAHGLFYIFHPLHICLSAIVTAGLYRRYLLCKKERGFLSFVKVLLVGVVGSVFIGTLSDSLIPFWGEFLLDMPARHAHIGFIDKWWLINPLAVIFVIIAYYRPVTKLPHAGHVFISTWASLFHMLMAAEGSTSISYFGIFVFLFLAVWIPCCFSDIVFPLLFVRGSRKDALCRHCHGTGREDQSG